MFGEGNKSDLAVIQKNRSLEYILCFSMNGILENAQRSS